MVALELLGGHSAPPSSPRAWRRAANSPEGWPTAHGPVAWITKGYLARTRPLRPVWARASRVRGRTACASASGSSRSRNTLPPLLAHSNIFDEKMFRLNGRDLHGGRCCLAPSRACCSTDGAAGILRLGAHVLGGDRNGATSRALLVPVIAPRCALARLDNARSLVRSARLKPPAPWSIGSGPEGLRTLSSTEPVSLRARQQTLRPPIARGRSL